MLTHDVEAAEGQAYVRTVADLDEGLGFRSSFNFVPERYPLIEYDLSFFDTDPLEPIPGAVMSIWPFTIGRFVELPYTLVQG